MGGQERAMNARKSCRGHSESARIFRDVGAFCLRLVALRAARRNTRRPVADVSAISISDAHDLFMKKLECARERVHERTFLRGPVH